jgi:uncharacterized membrane protein
MGNLLSDLLAYPHPMLNHFVIALLFVSVVLDLWGRWKSAIRYTAWVTLVLGTVATIPTVITGLIAHIPYETTPAMEAIETQLGLVTAVCFMALTFWRWRSRRNEATAAAPVLYLALAFVALGVLTATGLTGGHLVYQLGVGVKQLVK